MTTLPNSQMKIPKVSVILCVYNNSQYLLEAIESAAKQTYPNLDIFVIDDASTEELPIGNANWINFDLPHSRIEEISHSRKYNWSNNRTVYYIRLKTNGGPARARNIGIANAMLAGSHLFQILDSDDVMFPKKVEELIKPILLDPERVAITYGDYYIQNVRTGNISYESKPMYNFEKFFSGECHIHSGSLINVLALKQLGDRFYPEDQRVCEDFFMARSLLRSTQWVALNVGIPLTLVRSHDNDSTSSVSKDIWERDFQKTMRNS